MLDGRLRSKTSHGLAHLHLTAMNANCSNSEVLDYQSLEFVIWFSMSRGGFWGGLGISTGVCTQVCAYLLIAISFNITKLIFTLFCYYLRSGGDIYMICNRDHTQKCGWSLSTDVEGTWRVGQKILFLMNGSWKLTCWPIGQPIGQWVDLFTKSNPLANGSTRWPTPYNWRVGYNRAKAWCTWPRRPQPGPQWRAPTSRASPDTYVHI